MKWYSEYLKVYERPFTDDMMPVCEEVRCGMEALQSDSPEVTISVIAYNEERHLLACLWSLSRLKTTYRVEIIGVDNSSRDRTAEIFRLCGVPVHTETRHSCGWARLCGLTAARGRYHFNIDADTMYPPLYIDRMMRLLSAPGVVGVSSLWSYIPDNGHSAFGLWVYETLRDIHLWLQHFKRPELSVRGLVFAYRVEPARQIGIRTDIIRGEDGYLAFRLKDHGRIAFLRDSDARPVTGYGTVAQSGGLWSSLLFRLRKYLRRADSIFTSRSEYNDEDDNLVRH